jgi:hypothetical protein
MQEYAPPRTGERDTPTPNRRERSDQIVNREQDRAALTDNHRDGCTGFGTPAMVDDARLAAALERQTGVATADTLAPGHRDRRGSAMSADPS